MKTINDTTHGHITLTPLQEKLIKQPELQRLAWIRQLGLTKLVYPGANHTRLEHSLGVSYIAGKIAEHLKFDEYETNLVQATGMLHDLGHAPFSHTLEKLFKFDHMKFTADLISGKEKMPFPNAGKIPEILEKFEIKPKDIGDLINKNYKGKKYLQQAIFGGLDADQMDYLVRDAYYSGVNYGLIDIERTIKTMSILKDEIVFYEKGISSVESFLIARNHMYSTVYIHHAVVAGTKMMLRAAESVVDKIPEFYTLTDGEMIAKLKELTPYTKDIAERILYRNLFKRAYEISSIGTTSSDIKKLEKLDGLTEKKIEEMICKKTGIKPGYVIVDLPIEGLKTSEPRFNQTNIKLLRKDGNISEVYQISSIARALTKKQGTYSLFSVFSKKEDVEKIQKVIKKMLL